MTDNTTISTPIPEPVVTPVATPEPVQTVIAPVQEVPAPVVSPTAVVEAPTAPAPAQTIIGQDLDNNPVVEAPKPAAEVVSEIPEVKTEGTNTDGGQSVEPAPPPKFDPFKFPENASVDEARVTEFTNLLANLEVQGKLSHELTQETGQKLVDFHIAEVTKSIEDYTKLITTNWEKQKTDWKEAFMKDPEIGGNRWQATVDSARSFIRTHGGTQEQQTEFRDLMEASGLGNHPAMIRMFANASRAYKEGTPLAAVTPVTPNKTSKTGTLYGKR